MNEPCGVRIGNGVGNLDGQLHGPAHVHRPAGHLRPQRLPLQKLEDEEDAALVLAGIEERGDIRMRQRDRGQRACSSSAVRLAASGANSGGSRRIATVRPSTRVARAEQLAGTRRLEALEQVVVGDDADTAAGDGGTSSRLSARSRSAAAPSRRRSARARARCPASAPGMPRALAVDAVLADHRERVGQQIERHREAAARGSHHRLVHLERVAVLVEGRHVPSPSFGGCAGRISTRLGRLRDGWRADPTTTCATSSGASFQSSFAYERPPLNSVRTEPGRTHATRMPSCRTSCISDSLKAFSAGLRRAVARRRRRTDSCSQAADVDDPAAAARPQVRQRRLAAVKHAGQVRVDDTLPLVEASCRRPAERRRRRRC